MIQKRFKSVMMSIVIFTMLGTFNLSIAVESVDLLVDNAIENFKLKNYDGAIDYATRAIKFDPSYAHAYYVIAASHVEKSKNLESALANIEKAIHLNRFDYRYHSLKGEILEKLGRNDEALEVYEYTYRFFPESADEGILTGIGWLHYIKGVETMYKNREMANIHFNKAVEFYGKQIELKPQTAFSYRWRANSYLKIIPTNFTSAEKDYKKAIELAMAFPN